MEEYLIELRNFFRYLILSYRYLWNKRLFQIIGILSVILSYFRIIFGFLGKNDRNLIFKFCEIFFFNLSLKNRQMQNTGVNRFKLQKFPLNVNNYNSYGKIYRHIWKEEYPLTSYDKILLPWYSFKLFWTRHTVKCSKILKEHCVVLY